MSKTGFNLRDCQGLATVPQCETSGFAPGMGLARPANRMLRNWLNWLGARPAASDTGAFAEGVAAEWLRRERHFEVVARNWRNPRDEREEIDLICRDRDVLVFIEVKARAEHARVPGYYAVNRRKKRVLLSATKAYLVRLNSKPRTFRFDIVEVAIPVRRGGPEYVEAEPQVRHFENVPLFSKYFRG